MKILNLFSVLALILMVGCGKAPKGSNNSTTKSYFYQYINGYDGVDTKAPLVIKQNQYYGNSYMNNIFQNGNMDILLTLDNNGSFFMRTKPYADGASINTSIEGIRGKWEITTNRILLKQGNTTIARSLKTNEQNISGYLGNGQTTNLKSNSFALEFVGNVSLPNNAYQTGINSGSYSGAYLSVIQLQGVVSVNK